MYKYIIAIWNEYVREIYNNKEGIIVFIVISNTYSRQKYYYC